MRAVWWRVPVFVVLIFVVSFVFISPAYGATLFVSTLVDENNPPSGDTGCSLREAVIAANTDTAYGGCPAGSGTDTIRLAAATHILSSGFELNVTSPLIIDSLSGDPTNTFIQAAAAVNTAMHRVFNISPAGNLTLNDLTVRYGGMGIFPITGGGGIYNDGTLRLDNTIIRDNHATAGAGVFSTGTLTVTGRSQITNNTAALLGGGLYVTGNTDIEGISVISDNTATSGGGIYQGGLASTLSVFGSRVRFNTGTAGVGGIHHNLGEFEMQFSLLEFNTGGAYLNDGDPAVSSMAYVCIVGNDDTAVVDTTSSDSTDTSFVWWGSPAGPYTPATDTVGDSISGFVIDDNALTTNLDISLDCGTCTLASSISNGRDLRTCTPGY